MIHEIREEKIRPVLPEWFNEAFACGVLGWRWMSWFGIPKRGTKGYPKECRVRQLLSPGQLKNKRWKAFLEKNDGREAEGDEPLAYAYCSSGGGIAVPPDVLEGLESKIGAKHTWLVRACISSKP